MKMFSKLLFLANAPNFIQRKIPKRHLDILDGKVTYTKFFAEGEYSCQAIDYEAMGIAYTLYPVHPNWCESGIL